MGELLERHLPGLLAFVRLRADPRVRLHESAADVVQSVCREVLTHLDRFQYRSEAHFRQWLYRTAERKLIDRLRRHGAAKRGGGAEPRVAPERVLESYASFCSPSRAAIAREELARVEAAFEELGAEEREVVVLARVVGLEHAEIARQVDKSVDAVRSTLYRALSRLAALLG